MISFSCDQCGQSIRVQDHAAGRQGRCKGCGALMVVPTPKSDSPWFVEEREPIVPSPIVDSPAWPPRTHNTNIGINSRRGVAKLEPSGKPAADDFDAILAELTKVESPVNPPKTSMRTRRLRADAEQVRCAFQNFEPIRVFTINGEPPDHYQILYQVRGLQLDENRLPTYRDRHIVEIQLTSEYPRQSPKCKMLTPVFHPNIEPAIICVGDHWTAAERLVDLIVRIGEMLAYQAYNVKSPLDGEAAMWAEQNREHFPTDPRDLKPPDNS